jgi:hypothetical protein
MRTEITIATIEHGRIIKNEALLRIIKNEALLPSLPGSGAGASGQGASGQLLHARYVVG